MWDAQAALVAMHIGLVGTSGQWTAAFSKVSSTSSGGVLKQPKEKTR